MAAPLRYPRCRYFPVRHHSPRAAAVLRRAFDETPPALILVEGPSDATPLIEVLVDPETRPPVAILGYRTDGTPGSTAWPFASYSPEYQALLWAKEHGVPARFIDLTVGQSLARPEAATEPEVGAPTPGPGTLAAEARGLRSFDELWEAYYEAPDHDELSFRAAIMGYAESLRDGPELPLSSARDAVMAQAIEAAIDEGHAPEQIAVVAGAAHVVAFLAGTVDLGRIAELPAPLASAFTLIPYSFPRLSEQLGYGAGNRAPLLYQKAHDANTNFERAGLEVLLELTDHLRLSGFQASLADTIEAHRLSRMLAQIRGKAAPGLDELREAAIATLGRGDPQVIQRGLVQATIGKNVGQVAARIGKTSLQEEFWREVQARRLPATDAPERFSLRLGNALEIESSSFLHRLRLADVPYAHFLGREGRRGKNEDEAAGGYAALARAKETWEAQWTPATDIGLVERVILGDTLEQVAERCLEAQLAEGGDTGALAELLLDAVVAACPRSAARALSACSVAAAADDDLPSLAKAARALSGLLSFGATRAKGQLGEAAIGPLLQILYTRAVLRAQAAARVDDQGAEPIKAALRILHELALAQSELDQELWLGSAAQIAEDWSVNPSCAGLVTGLLYVAQRYDEAAIAERVALRLSLVGEPARAAGFLEGFLEVNALVLVKSKPVVKALDQFLTQLEVGAFKDQLPLLRRAFSRLGKSERRYLLENVLAARRLGAQAPAAKAILVEKDRATLAAVNTELAQALDDLDDLL